MAADETCGPTPTQSRNEAEQYLGNDHRGSESYAERSRLFRTPRLGHIGERNGDRSQRDRIKAKDKSGHERDAECEKARMFYGVLERFGVQFKLPCRSA